MKLTMPKTIARFASAALFAAAAVCTARADSPYSTYILSNNPVGYWRFDETAASPPLNVITNAGLEGAAGTGYVVNNGATSPTLGTNGLIGTSVFFSNPGGTVGACLSKIEVPWLPLNNTFPPFSVELWAKPTTLTDSTGLCPISNFSGDYNFGATRDGWLFYVPASGAWNFRLGSHSGYSLSLVVTNGFATLNTWQHIVATWDGTNALVYANGVVVGGKYATVSGAAPGNNSPYYGNPNSIIRFGGSPLAGNNNLYPSAIAGTVKNGNRGWDGFVQHVAIYTNVLTPVQVAAHYSAASTNNAGYIAQIKASNPVGYWPMNDVPLATPTAPFPVAVNAGTLGSLANGTNFPGALAAKSGPGYGGFGADTNSVFFDGANGYMQVNETAGLHFTGNITLAAWVKPTEQDFYRDIIAHGINAVDAETFLRISSYDSTYLDQAFYEVGSSDGVNYYDSALYPIPAGDIGNWVFLVGTYDGSNWNLYRNGQLVAQLPPEDQGGAGAYDVTNQWTIGSRGVDSLFQGQGSFFGGNIYQPAIFTNALSATDVYNLYLAAHVPPVITTPPVNPGVVYEGSSFSLSVLAEGDPTLLYQWYVNGTPISGATSSTYTKTAPVAANSGIYSVVVNNSYGSITSSVPVSVLPSVPIVTTQPLPVNRFVGFPYSFSVSAVGTQPIGYQWLTNGTPIPGATSSTYSNLAQLSFAGNFSVVLTNALGSVTSSPALFTVLPVPSGYPGAVVASSPIAYWRLDETSGTVAHDLVGGYNGTYVSATLGVPGYSVLDSDTAASFNGLNSYVGNISGTGINFITNQNFTLEAWVNAPSGQADQATIIAKGIGNNGTVENEQFVLDVAGGSYRFYTYGGGRGGAVYQADAVSGPNGTWQHVVGVYDGQNALGGGAKMYIYVNGVQEGSGASPGAPYQSSITSPVSIGSKRTGNDPGYDGTFDGTVDEVAVYNYALSASTVNAHYASAYGTTLAPVITIEPSSATNYVGLPVTLSVSAYGSQPVNYQWYEGSTPVGGNSSFYTVPSTAYTDAGTYHVNISNNVGSTNSATASIVVLAPPSSPPVIPGLVMHLPFNGNFTDVTGRGNNGTGLHSGYNPTTMAFFTNSLNPSPATNPQFYYTDSPFGTNVALHYSTYAESTNTSGLDDYYVKIGTKPDLQFGSNVDFTVSYWIRYPQGYGEGSMFGGGGDLPAFTTAITSLGGAGFDFATPYAYGTQGTGGAATLNSAGSWGFTLYDGNGDGVGVGLMGTIGAINDGSYHNLIYVINRSTKVATTYLDGVISQSFLMQGTKLADLGNVDSGSSATVGQDPTGLYGELGSADISDLGVWRKALTPLEAGSVYIAAVSNQLSYAYAPFSFTYTNTGGSLAFTWSYGYLQSSTNVAGPYTDVSSAGTTTVSTTSGIKFFRVRH
jgi:hypothetical protein